MDPTAFTTSIVVGRVLPRRNIRTRVLRRPPRLCASSNAGSAVAPSEPERTTLSPRARSLLAAYANAPLYESTGGMASEIAKSVARGEVNAPAALVGRADELVSTARLAIERAHPGIAAPGGALYPAARARACWRDLACFLATGAAVESDGGRVRPKGVEILRELYAELGVPIDAMVTGLRALGDAVREDARVTADALFFMAEQLQ